MGLAIGGEDAFDEAVVSIKISPIFISHPTISVIIIIIIIIITPIYYS